MRRWFLGVLAALAIIGACTFPLEFEGHGQLDVCIQQDSLRVTTDTLSGAVTVDTLYLGRCVGFPLPDSTTITATP